MLGKKTILPPPPTPAETKTETLQRLEDMKKELEKELEEKEQEEQEQIPDIPILPPPSEEITNEMLLDALQEHHKIMLAKFDQIYFKVDQTQDLLLMKPPTEKIEKKRA